MHIDYHTIAIFTQSYILIIRLSPPSIVQSICAVWVSLSDFVKSPGLINILSQSLDFFSTENGKQIYQVNSWEVQAQFATLCKHKMHKTYIFKSVSIKDFSSGGFHGPWIIVEWPGSVGDPQSWDRMGHFPGRSYLNSSTGGITFTLSWLYFMSEIHRIV